MLLFCNTLLFCKMGSLCCVQKFFDAGKEGGTSSLVLERAKGGIAVGLLGSSLVARHEFAQ
jgi:hypothetical protein